MAGKMSFGKIILCWGPIKSPINIHKFNLCILISLGTQAWIRVLLKTITFIWKLRKMWIDQNMVAYYLRKWDFDSKDSKWIFKIDFYVEHFEKKHFILKIKEINLKTTKHKKQTTKQKERKQNHKVECLTTEQIKLVRMEAKCI